MSRPRRLVVVTGTSTEVGKTWLAEKTLALLRARGVSVAARKPAQSFAPDTGPTDSVRLADATGEDAHAVCPPHRSYPLPLAPPMAAEALGWPPVSLAELLAELGWPDPPVAVGMVEGVGGPRSPLAADGDTVDLVDAIDPDLVVVVSDAGLGAINATRLTAAPFASRRVIVALNHFGDDPLHERNRSYLAKQYGFDVVARPSELADQIMRL